MCYEIDIFGIIWNKIIDDEWIRLFFDFIRVGVDFLMFCECVWLMLKGYVVVD